MKQLLLQISQDNTNLHNNFDLKNKKIYKNKKNTIKNQQQNQQGSSISQTNSKHKLTKQQRFQLQKIKNRQSAQRSRDMKKLYIEKLQKQNAHLNKQIQDLINKINKNVCSKCSKEANTEIQIHQNSQQQTQVLNKQVINDDQRYERLISQNHQNKFHMFVFIVITIIGILILESTPNMQKSPEVLFNLNTMNKLQNDYQNSYIYFNQPKVSSNNQVSSEIAINHRNQKSCLMQYLKQKKRIFTHSLPPKNLRVKNPTIYQTKNNDILLCQMPQIIKHNKSQSLISKYLQILIKGDELSNTMKIQDSDVNPNSLYILLTEVKDIVKYSNFQCLA